MHKFKAIVVNKEEGLFSASIQELDRDSLPAGDVLVSVAYSSLNYKDALAVTGQPGVVKRYPMVPGIDLAGTIEETGSEEFKRGDQVIVTGYGVGENHWGGYAQMARLKADWLVPLPSGIGLKEAMGVGTAGFTAMQCVTALEQLGLKPDAREVLVTGAAGGVGSVAVAILAKLGYRVVASTGRPETHEYLKGLGAESVIDREVLSTPSKKPLEPERWSGAVDSVGGQTLASVLRQMAYGASVAACGLAGGGDLPATVYPFILRGISLIGVDSVQAPQDARRAIWARIARDLPMGLIDRMTQVAGLADVFELSGKILQGKVRGRTVIDVNA